MSMFLNKDDLDAARMDELERLYGPLSSHQLGPQGE